MTRNCSVTLFLIVNKYVTLKEAINWWSTERHPTSTMSPPGKVRPLCTFVSCDLQPDKICHHVKAVAIILQTNVAPIFFLSQQIAMIIQAKYFDRDIISFHFHNRIAEIKIKGCFNFQYPWFEFEWMVNSDFNVHTVAYGFHWSFSSSEYQNYLWSHFL